MIITMKTINIIGETIILLPPAGCELLLLLPYVSLRAEGEAISSFSFSLLRHSVPRNDMPSITLPQ